MVQRKVGERGDPGLPGLRLESLAADQSEEDMVSAVPKPAGQLDYRVGAPGPPTVGGKVKDRQAVHLAIRSR